MLCQGKGIDEEKIAKLVQDSLNDISVLIKEKQYDLVILDELLNALLAEFCSIEQIQSLIQEAKDLELVLTGRSVPDDLVEYADYISNVTKIKHPFDRKIVARKGIEY
jgi:cob(I)alamin adenosyltransferase